MVPGFPGAGEGTAACSGWAPAAPATARRRARGDAPPYPATVGPPTKNGRKNWRVPESNRGRRTWCGGYGNQLRRRPNTGYRIPGIRTVREVTAFPAPAHPALPEGTHAKPAGGRSPRPPHPRAVPARSRPMSPVAPVRTARGSGDTGAAHHDRRAGRPRHPPLPAPPPFPQHLSDRSGAPEFPYPAAPLRISPPPTHNGAAMTAAQRMIGSPPESKLPPRPRTARGAAVPDRTAAATRRKRGKTR
jgi:hypothetical protein